MEEGDLQLLDSMDLSADLTPEELLEVWESLVTPPDASEDTEELENIIESSATDNVAWMIEYRRIEAALMAPSTPSSDAGDAAAADAPPAASACKREDYAPTLRLNLCRGMRA